MGVRGVGPTLAAAFEQAALAMTAVVADPASVTPAMAIDIECEAPDDELLLVDWLNALILEMATRHMLFSRFEVGLDGGICMPPSGARRWTSKSTSRSSKSRALPTLN